MEPGRLIRDAREKRGWSRSELSRQSNVDRALVTRIEDGERTGSVDTVVAIAKVLDIDLNLLKTDPDAPFEEAPTVTN